MKHICFKNTQRIMEIRLPSFVLALTVAELERGTPPPSFIPMAYGRILIGTALAGLKLFREIYENGGIFR